MKEQPILTGVKRSQDLWLDLAFVIGISLKYRNQTRFAGGSKMLRSNCLESCWGVKDMVSMYS